MKKKKLEEHEQQHHRDIEVLKAVAQAWYSHSGSCRPMNEFDTRPRNFKGKPSRFKLETLTKSSSSSTATTNPASAATCCWDFQQSLWDPYELVTVSRRIETGLALDNPFDELCGSPLIQPRRKPRESKNSLRNLFNNMSSRRFNSPKLPHENK